MHRRALDEVGSSELEFLQALAKGVNTGDPSHPIFGGAKHISEEVQLDRRQLCRGLIVIPHIRQWWARDDKGKKLLIKEAEYDERGASTLELFYDLIFVALISSMVHALAYDITLVYSFIIHFSVVWRIWNVNLHYLTFFDSRDLTHKWLSYFEMMGVCFMTLNAYDSIRKGGTVPFAISIIVAHVPLLISYTFLSVRKHRGYQVALVPILFLFFCSFLTLQV